MPFFAFSQRINTSFIFVFQGIADHYFDLSYKDRIISFLPMSHIAAQLFDIHVPIYLGNCLTRLNRLTHFLLISSCLLYCVAFKNQEHLSSLIISKHIISYLISSHYIISYHVVSQQIRQQYFTSYHPPVIPCFLTSRFPILPPPATNYPPPTARLLCVFLPARCPQGISHSHYERSQTDPFLFCASCVGENSRKDD